MKSDGELALSNSTVRANWITGHRAVRSIIFVQSFCFTLALVLVVPRFGQAAETILADGFDGPCMTCTVAISLSTPDGFNADHFFTASTTNQLSPLNLRIPRDVTSIAGAVSSAPGGLILLATVPAQSHYDSGTLGIDSIQLDYQSTAEALISFAPGLLTHSPKKADYLHSIIHQTPEVAALGAYLAQNPSMSSLNTTNFAMLANNALSAVASALAAQPLPKAYSKSKNDRRNTQVATSSATPTSKIYEDTSGGHLIPSLSFDEKTLTLKESMGDVLHRIVSVEHISDVSAFIVGGTFAPSTNITESTVAGVTGPDIASNGSTNIPPWLEGLGYTALLQPISSIATIILESSPSFGLGVITEPDVVQIRAFSGGNLSSAEEALLSNNSRWRTYHQTARWANILDDVSEFIQGVIAVATFDSTIADCVKNELTALYTNQPVNLAMSSYADAWSLITTNVETLANQSGGCFAGSEVAYQLIAKAIVTMSGVGDAEVIANILHATADGSVLAESMLDLFSQPSIQTAYVARLYTPTSIESVIARNVNYADWRTNPYSDVEIIFSAVLSLPLTNDLNIEVSCASNICPHLPQLNNGAVVAGTLGSSNGTLSSSGVLRLALDNIDGWETQLVCMNVDFGTPSSAQASNLCINLVNPAGLVASAPQLPLDTSSLLISQDFNGVNTDYLHFGIIYVSDLQWPYHGAAQFYPFDNGKLSFYKGWDHNGYPYPAGYFGGDQVFYFCGTDTDLQNYTTALSSHIDANGYFTVSGEFRTSVATNPNPNCPDGRGISPLDMSNWYTYILAGYTIQTYNKGLTWLGDGSPVAFDARIIP